MQTLLFYALKVMIYSAIFFGYYCIALRNKRFHHYNRFYLLLTVVLSLFLPLIHLQLWQWNSSNTGVIKLLSVTTANDYEAVVSSHSSALDWANIASLCYCIIALGLLLAAALSVLSIFRLKTKYKVDKIESINFINTDLEQSPFSFFNNLFWKNTLLLTDEGGKQIFKHELTHIEQKHSWDKLFMRIVTALFWFNPLYWLAQKELSMIHEFIADEKAVENKSAEAFAMMILQSQYSKSVFSPAQSFHYSPIKRRLLMLTTSKKPSFSYARRIMLLPLLAISLFLFAFKLKKNETKTNVTHTNTPFVLVVDAGHGGTDNGAIGLNDVNEKDINLSIAKKIEELAPEYGVKVLMTREDDKTVSLQDRMDFIRVTQPNACVSIHINSSAGQETVRNGASIYIPRNETKDNYKQSYLLGSTVLQNVEKNFTVDSTLLQRKSKGIYIIDSNPYPAIILECGYINNDNDLKQLADNTKMEQLARDILKGVVAYANADKNASLLNHDNGSNDALQSSTDTTKKPTPLYIVDGKETSAEAVDNMDKNKIESINVLKGTEATKQYGDKGKNGVVIIQLKKGIAFNSNKQNKKGKTDNNGLEIKMDKADSALIVLDGTTINTKQLYVMKPDAISSINILKGESAISKYGEKGSNGVIEITSKNVNNEKQETSYFSAPVIVKDDKQAQDTSGKNGKEENYERTFVQTQVPASFPGSKEGWLKYLQRNLKAEVPTNHGAVPGTYKVVVSFLVDTEGKLSDVKAQNDPGYGTAAEAVRVIKEGPNWIPAKQNGKTVTAETKQAIAFQVSEGR